MTAQPQIPGRKQLVVNGADYEWNDVFNAYWSVRGNPRQLSAEDFLVEVELSRTDGGLDSYAVRGHPCVHRARVPNGIKTGETFQAIHGDEQVALAIWKGDVKTSLLAFVPSVDGAA